MRKIEPNDVSNQKLYISSDNEICYINQLYNPNERNCWATTEDSFKRTDIDNKTFKSAQGKSFKCEIKLVNSVKSEYQKTQTQLNCEDELFKLIDAGLTQDSTELDHSNPNTKVFEYPSVNYSCDTIKIVAGQQHICLYTEFTLKSWNIQCQGDNTYDQLIISPEVLAEPYSIVNIHSGPYNTCASLNSGILHCWGKTDNKINVVPEEFSQPESKHLYSQDISVSLDFACGIKINTQLAIYNLICWGQCDKFGSREVENADSEGGNSKCEVPQGLSNQAYQVTTGWDHACNIIQTDKQLKCFGNNSHGQTDVPIIFSSQTMVVTAGNQLTCAIRSNFLLECWGVNNFVPAKLRNQTYAVTSGGRHTCGMHGGDVSCWGSGDQGQLTLPPGMQQDNWSIKAGWDFNCGMDLNLRLQCWGFNFHGQTEVAKALPQRNNGTEFKTTQVTTGLIHSCALVTKQVMHPDLHQSQAMPMPACWGGNEQGQTEVLQSFRFYVGDINVGDEHTCAARSQYKPGMAVIGCWGSNEQGQTDLPAKLKHNYELITQSDLQISCGGAHSCVLAGMADSARLECWGSDSHGQMAKLKSYKNTNIHQVSAGAVHTCIIRLSSGPKSRGVSLAHSVVCWGMGYREHDHVLKVLGDMALNPYVLSTNWDHNCVADNHGTPICWGDDDQGQSTPPKQLQQKD